MDFLNMALLPEACYCGELHISLLVFCAVSLRSSSEEVCDSGWFERGAYPVTTSNVLLVLGPVFYDDRPVSLIGFGRSSSTGIGKCWR